MITGTSASPSGRETLCERAVIARLNELDPREYVAAARRGRAQLPPELRQAAATLYTTASEWHGRHLPLSRIGAGALDLARRVCFSEWFLDRHPTPRYAAYTNTHVISWALAVNRRTPLSSVAPRCWAAIRFLIDEHLEFELASAADRLTCSQRHFCAADVVQRIALLVMIRARIKDRAAPIAPAALPDRWDACIGPDAVAIVLRYLTALPQTDFHDEMLFVRAVHVMECCCYGIVAEVIAAIEWIKTRDFEDAARALHEAAELAEVLFPLFCAVQTIRADRFFDFRAATGNASAIQSRMYQLMQIYVQGLDEAKAPVMAHLPEVADLLLLGDRRFRTLPRALVDLDRVGGAPEAIVDGARQLDRALYRWRSLHVAIARDYLSGHSAGPGLRGTGATSGVPYLQAHSYRRVFPLSERDEPPAATPAFPRTPFAPLFGPAN